MSTVVSALTALLDELAVTEMLAPEALEALQLRRLALLTAHLEMHSAQFRRRLRDAGLGRKELLAPGGLQRLPVLSRRDLQDADHLFCEALPAGHGSTYETRTSGSTGEPVTVRRTTVNGMDWMAILMRDHRWHKRDFRMPFCSIRANVGELVLSKDWGAPVNWLFDSGPQLGIPLSTDIERQIQLIREFKPQLLLVYPSNLAAFMNRGVDLPSVRQILTIGETLAPQTREDACRQFGTITDTYSSQELGTIAIQCPESPLYHVMADNLIVEVLDSDGMACKPGDAGRVVVTDLRNFATPLVRYDVGDVAQTGPPCRCGRGLPTLSRIFGRERNLVLLPDGTRHWPLVGFAQFREIAPVMQYQFVQDSRDTLEFRLVTKRPLSLIEEAGLTARVQQSLGFAFTVHFTYFTERIPAQPNGKFEEFVCKVAA